MAGFVSYELENDKAFRERIEKAFEETGDLRIPFSLIAKDFYKSEKAIFQLSGPGKYPKFKGEKNEKTGLTAYESFKKRQYGFTYPLLKASERLMDSVTSSTHKDSVLQISKASLIIGTTVEYANFHQQDNPDLGNKVMPTRKFLFIGPEAPENVPATRGRLDRWLKILDRHISQVTGGKNV
jgi:phage gpG-like protein